MRGPFKELRILRSTCPALNSCMAYLAILIPSIQAWHSESEVALSSYCLWFSLRYIIAKQYWNRKCYIVTGEPSCTGQDFVENLDWIQPELSIFHNFARAALHVKASPSIRLSISRLNFANWPWRPPRYRFLEGIVLSRRWRIENSLAVATFQKDDPRGLRAGVAVVVEEQILKLYFGLISTDYHRAGTSFYFSCFRGFRL